MLFILEISKRFKVILPVCLILCLFLNLCVSNNSVNASTSTPPAVKNEQLFDLYCYNESEIERQMEEDLLAMKFNLVKDGLNEEDLGKLRDIKKQIADQKEKIKLKWDKIKGMSLKELDKNGYIEQLCEKYDMPKLWFDRISITESSYGVYTPAGSYNAWGWGIYGDKVTKIDDNWYDSSSFFIQEFMKNYGANPSVEDMLRYCPGGAYNKFFSKADQVKAERIMAIYQAKEKAKKEKEKREKAKKEKAKKIKIAKKKKVIQEKVKKEKAKKKKEEEKRKKEEQKNNEKEKAKEDENDKG